MTFYFMFPNCYLEILYFYLDVLYTKSALILAFWCIAKKKAIICNISQCYEFYPCKTNMTRFTGYLRTYTLLIAIFKP